jgi:hypothetical protein
MSRLQRKRLASLHRRRRYALRRIEAALAPVPGFWEFWI